MAPKIFYYSASGFELLSLARAYQEALRIKPFELILRTGAEIFDSREEERAAELAAEAEALVFLPHGGERSLPGFQKIISRAKKARLIHVQPVAGSDEDLLLAQKYSRPKEGFETRAAYLRLGGVENLKNFFLALLMFLEGQKGPWPPPQALPTEGLYHPQGGFFADLSSYLAWLEEQGYDLSAPKVGIWFYQGYWVNGDLAPVSALISALEEKGALAFPVFHRRFVEKGEEALRPKEVARKFFLGDRGPLVEAIINLQPFSHRLLWPETEDLYPKIGVPVLQGLISFSPRKVWEESPAGLSPLELAISVAQPEFDGTLITTLVATREEGEKDPLLGVRLRRLVPVPEGVARVTGLALNWARLFRLPPAKRRVAIIFHHYPPRADRVGCAFGLDSFASVVELLKALKKEGYHLEELYSSGEELAQKLLTTLVAERRYLTPAELARKAKVSVSCAKVLAWVRELPAEVRQKLEEAWGSPPGDLFVHQGRMYFSGFLNGNIFLSVQPPRGKHEKLEDGEMIHDPHLPPPYHYLAFYRFVAEEFGAHAVVHVGKHGTLEWLPGKAVALSRECYPDLAIDSLPNIYPYIVNDPGEGTQAKRRSYCAIIDHMIPPQMAAGRYGVLEELARLLEEHRVLRGENPAQAESLARKIIEKACAAGLNEDLSLSREEMEKDPAFSLARLHDYLDEVASTLVNEGLHILGRPPQGEASRQTAQAIAKGAGLTEEEALVLLEGVKEEIPSCLKALSGGFVLPGPSGAPTRGEPDVLPTGRNFYSVDPQKIPTKLAWERGVRQAEALLSRHLKDHGRYPRTLAMVIWGSPTMRTRGEDLACALYLLGVRPVWHEKNQRVLGVEPIPLSTLKRPRIDVTLRTSGFFRDAFRNLMELFDEAVRMVALLEEDEEENFLAAHYRKDLAAYLDEGLSREEATRLAGLRVFSDPPGAYGAGVSELLDTGTWKERRDLAESYVAWAGFAYGKDFYGLKAHESFKKVLSRVEVTYKNDDTREIDILSCDCPNAYHGGLNAAVEAVSGRRPVSYTGSTNDPERPQVRTTAEEMRFLFRIKVLNPKWIEGMKRHGYKGAGDLSRLIDYCFQWDATSDVLADWMYEEIAQTYTLAPEMQAFFKKHNPRALLNIVERLLEAAKRGLWQRPEPKTLEALKDLYLQIEALVE